MFQCYSHRSSHPRLLPQSPKDCSIHLCIFCCLAYRVVSITARVRVTLPLGPPLLCGVCDISCCDVNGAPLPAPHTGGTPALASPHQLLGRIPAPIPSGRGQSVGPEPNPRQQPPSQSEPTAKCTFQAQAVTFLSPKLQKRNEI